MHFAFCIIIKLQGCWNWQTSRPQTPVFLTCGFKSRPLHQKRSNFCLPKVTSFFIQAAGLAYHHDAVVYIISPFGAVSHHASACILLRLDEMQHCVLMICNSCRIDDIQGFALIYLLKSDII